MESKNQIQSAPLFVSIKNVAFPNLDGTIEFGEGGVFGV
jgi:hypothetical protein